MLWDRFSENTELSRWVKMVSDRFEDAVDRFEMHWHESSREMILDSLQQAELADDVHAISELVRIDIQRRYWVDLPVDLKPYLDLLSGSSQDAVLCSIAYEDFRTRQARDLSCSPERWSQIPGIGTQPWYQSLVANRQRTTAGMGRTSEPNADVLTKNHGVVASAEDALQSVGFLPIRQIGHGAFSRVFLARQESLANRPVVIKSVQRDFDEADRMAELQHTNIVPIYSFHRSGSWSMLCMPYAGLVTLADYFEAVPDSHYRSGQSIVSTIRRAQEGTFRKADANGGERDSLEGLSNEETGPTADSVFDRIMPLPRDAMVLWMFARLADGLHHAHQRGILHADIKPANLLIRNDGEPALLDFNLSRRFDDAGPATIGGTLPYMSPESLKALMGATVAITVESDLYSLGAVLYQFLTNRLAYAPPHSSEPIDLELAISVRQAKIRWDRTDNVSPGIRAIVEKCLAASVADRYASAEQLRDDLERELQNLPLKYAREHSLRHRLRKWVARHPRMTSAASVTFASIGVILVMGLLTWRVNESRENLLAIQNFQQFEWDAKIALAELLYVDRTDKAKAMQATEDCLSTYHILHDDRWQERTAWKRLSDLDQQRALTWMTSLLLRRSWIELSDSSTASTDRRPKIDSAQKKGPGAIALLTSPPFISQAPLSIGFLSQGIKSPPQATANAVTLDAEAIARDGLTPLDQLGLATKYIEQGEGEAALMLLPASLLGQIDPYTYWVALGRAQMTMSDLRAAELSFSMAIETYSAPSAAFHYRGVCRMKKREVSESQKAIEDFSSALHRNPDAIESLINRAMAREACGDLQGAMVDLEKVVQQDPNDAQALIVQSRVYRKQEQIRDAKRALESALQTHPNSVSGWISLALTRLAFDKRAALQDLLQAQKLSPDSIEVLQNLAHVYSEHLGEHDKAIETLDRLLAINPTYELALLGRGVIHARGGDVEAALDDLKAAIAYKKELQPSSSYQAACIFAQSLTHSDNKTKSKYKELALAYLSTAIQSGYGADSFESDADLASLRDDPRFQSLQSAVQTSRALQQVQWYDHSQ